MGVGAEKLPLIHVCGEPGGDAFGIRGFFPDRDGVSVVALEPDGVAEPGRARDPAIKELKEPLKADGMGIERIFCRDFPRKSEEGRAVSVMRITVDEFSEACAHVRSLRERFLEHAFV